MPTLIGTTQRLELNQSSRIPTVEQLSNEKLVLWQGLSAKIDIAVFNDTPNADSIIDVANLDSINLVVRKNGPNGSILFTQETTTFTSTTYAAWVAETGKHATFEISELDTTQIVPQSGRLPIYFVITAITEDAVPFIAGFGYGEIIDVGFVENPVASDYITGRTSIVGGRLLTDLDLNGHDLVDSTLAGYTEEGEVTLTDGQLEVEVAFTWEKYGADVYRFDYLYVKDENGEPRDVRPYLTSQTALGFTLELSAGATAGTILYWAVKRKQTVPAPVPFVRYGIVPGVGDAVYYNTYDRGGQFFNVVAFGAENDGTTDDTEAFAAAVEAAHAVGGGTVFIPPGFCVINEYTIPYSGISVQGAGKHCSSIICDVDTAFALRLGVQNGAQFDGKISNLRVTRQAGTFSDDSIGISLVCYNDAKLEDVIVDHHGTAIKTSDGWRSFNVNLTLNGVQTHNAKIHLWAKDVAGVFINEFTCGQNGGDSVQPDVLFQFEGIINDVRAKTVQMVIGYVVDGDLVTSPATGVLWTGIGDDASGSYFLFDDFNMENITTAFRSDSTCQRIDHVNVTRSRLTQNGKLWDIHANTSVTNVSFSHNRSMKSDIPSTFTDCINSNFDHNICGSYTIDGGSCTFDHNTLVADVHFTGEHIATSIVGNLMVFNGAVPIRIFTEEATGNISRDLGVADFDDVGHPQPYKHSNVYPYKVADLDLTSIGPRQEVFVAPRDFIIDKAYAIITEVSGYSSSVLPQIIIDTGSGSDYRATMTVNSDWNALDHVALIKPLDTGLHKIVRKNQTLSVISGAANTSIALKATVYIFGYFVDV